MQPMTVAEVARLYDKRAEFQIDGTTNKTETDAAANIVDSLQLEKKARILDAGCGEGWLIHALSDRGYKHLYGIDVSAEALKLAALRAAKNCVVLILGDVSRQSAQYFDLVTAFNSSIGSFGAEGDRAYLKGISRSLSVQGQLVLTYIDQASAQKRVGTFRTNYNKTNPVEVVSDVQISLDGKWLIIDQIFAGQKIARERIRIIQHSHLRKLMDDVGLEMISDPEFMARINQSPYVATAFARKL